MVSTRLVRPPPTGNRRAEGVREEERRPAGEASPLDRPRPAAPNVWAPPFASTATPFAPAAVLGLQRTHSNAYVQRLFAARSGPLLLREDLPNDPNPSGDPGDQSCSLGLSDEGFNFLKDRERLARIDSKTGLVHTYNDSQGHCTIGVGHLVHEGNCNGKEPANFVNGITQDEALDLFRRDFDKYEGSIRDSVTGPINQYQYDALVSLTFNIGIAGFKGSTVLIEVNKKNYSKVPTAMMMWVKPPEIKGRRQKEADLFRTGNY